MEVVLVVIVVLALAGLWIAARAAITICVLDVSDGRVTVRRGGVAPRILADLGDVAMRPPIQQATLRITRDAGRAKLEAEGTLSPEQGQRLRNVVGSVPLATLTNARRRR
jgi:hypothetical protein